MSPSAVLIKIINFFCFKALNTTTTTIAPILIDFGIIYKHFYASTGAQRVMWVVIITKIILLGTIIMT